MLENIKINPEFEHLIPPLVDDEFELLKSNILSEQEIYTPIFVWNEFIIDGHHRFKILSENRDIKFRIVEKKFDNKYEAMSWICNNQLGRRNLTPENKKYLIGKRYDAEKLSYGSVERITVKKNKSCPSSQNGNLGTGMKTCERIAEETGTSKNYVLRADEFAKGVDAAEEAVPGIKKEILTGKIKKPAKEIAEIAKAPVEQRKVLTENLLIKKEKTNQPSDVKQNIKSTRAGMRNVDTPVSDESVLETLNGTVDMFINNCESTFNSYPNFLENSDNFQKVLKILEKANKYINEIKGDKR
ncbi:MAG: hypothetical protein IKV25_05125 [Clostridia bacterium]|nr:hypothetical protein [Clostridia bacterium]